ncbi:MAG: molybdopterin-dependent oxidoreductase [Chlorobiaceae bacterium]|nr:molybdopterin-dependent oxidoreductase [Chlorobiaceae bacterium]NTW83108.1 molybdopterin-dependent oxidoreductase [Chlorobiaceae bacterium]
MKSSSAKAIMLLLAVLYSAAPAMAKSNNSVSGSVTVTGLVEKPFTITPTSVKAMHTIERENSAIVCGSGETRKTLKTYKGVLLRDILDSAKVTMPNPHQRGEFAVLVRSTDNYNVLFSYNELYNGSAGDNTFLIFEENGKPIDKDGLFVVFCSNDKLTGLRHVKWVNNIDIIKVDAGNPAVNCKK